MLNTNYNQPNISDEITQKEQPTSSLASLAKAEMEKRQNTQVPDISEDDSVGMGMVIEHTKPQELSETAKIFNSSGVNMVAPDTISNLEKYLEEKDAEIEYFLEKEAKGEITKLGEEPVKKDDSDDEEEDSDDDSMTEDEMASKYKEAVVIIDKTKMGTIVNFTDEEREKLEKVKTIKLEEIEVVELSTIKTKKPKKKNLDNIIKRHFSSNLTPLVLPATGYVTNIAGCSINELFNILIDQDDKVIDAETKWSIIFNKLKESSIGDMDFNSFLMNTAAADYQTLLFGILCATYPEEDIYPLHCEKCNKDFEHRFSVKSLIRAEKISDKLSGLIMNTVDNSHIEKDAKNYHKNNSPLNTIKRVKLPDSGIIAEIYMQSAYDYIYRSIKQINKEKPDPRYTTSILTSSVIKNIYIPDEDGTYIEIDDVMDIIKVVYELKDIDIKVINKLADEMFSDTTFDFGFMDVKCTHCGTYTNSLSIDPEHILFFKFRQSQNTKIE